MSVRIFWFLHLSFASSICLQTNATSQLSTQLHPMPSIKWFLYLLAIKDLGHRAATGTQKLKHGLSFHQFGQGTIKLSVSCRMFLGMNFPWSLGKSFLKQKERPCVTKSPRVGPIGATLSCSTMMWSGQGIHQSFSILYLHCKHCKHWVTSKPE